MADDDYPDTATTVSPFGGPSFAVPPWMLAAQQQQAPAPGPSFVGGVPDLPPEVAAHLLGSPQPAAAAPSAPPLGPPVAAQPATPVGPPPAMGSPKALAQDTAKAERGANEIQAGLADEQQAAKQRAEAEAAKAQEDAQAVAAQNENLYGKLNPETGQRRGGLLADREKELAEYQKGRIAKTADATKAVDAYANYKIDPGRRWANMSTGQKIMSGIAIALSGIGMAIAGRPGENPAVKIMENAIQQDIEAQHAEQQKLGEVAGIKRSSLSDYRQQMQDDLAAKNMKIAEEYKRTADEIELAAAKHGSDIAKANGAAAAAELRQKAGILIDQAAAKSWDRDWAVKQAATQEKQHQQQLGVEYGHLALAQKQFEFQKTVHADEVNEKAAQLELAGRKEQAAELKATHAALGEQGMSIPTGKIATTPDGQAVPDADYAKQKDGSYWVAPKESAKDLHKVNAATINGVDALDKLRAARSKFSGSQQFENWLTSTEDGRALSQEMSRSIMAVHQASGVNRFSGEVVELSKDIITGGVSPKSAKGIAKALDQSRADLISNLDGEMRGNGYNGEVIGEKNFPDPLKAPKAPESPEKAQARIIENDTGAGPNYKTGEHSDAYKVLKQWGEDARSSDPATRKAALQKLEEASTDKGGSATIRAEANSIYARAITSHPNEAEAPAPKNSSPTYSNFSLPVTPTFGGR